MKRKTMIYLSVTAIFVLAGIFAWNTMARAAYESAEYKVVESDGKFEVREYPDLMLVATTTKLDAQGRDGSFMKLFRYISGANESDKKISMTTPVFMENDKEASAVQMGFVMPKDIAVEGVPAPTGEGVDVRKRAGGRFAVLRFSGQLTTKSAKESETKLRTWMATKGLVADDSVESSGVETAGYDPPFTPGPLRRNEVLIRVK
jgi:DNA gyrase inhibitor GyrI